MIDRQQAYNRRIRSRGYNRALRLLEKALIGVNYIPDAVAAAAPGIRLYRMPQGYNKSYKVTVIKTPAVLIDAGPDLPQRLADFIREGQNRMTDQFRADGCHGWLGVASLGAEDLGREWRFWLERGAYTGGRKEARAV